MYLAGDFTEKEATLHALREMKARGFGADRLDVFSQEPVDLPRGLLDRPARMSFASVAGAVIFCLLSIGFVYFTQYNYALVTGGMPLFSFWATGVVFYELTMLGAILTTFFWFLRESGLPRRRRLAVPVVPPGAICLRVRCGPEQQDAAARSLRLAGAINVRELEEQL